MWRRRQQLAWRLAQRDVVNQLIYVEQPLTLASLLKYLFNEADPEATVSWKRVFANRSLIFRPAANFYLVTPITCLPFTNSKILMALERFWRHRIQLFLIRRLMKKLKMKDIILWVSMPHVPLELLKRFKPKLLWYDCTEDFTSWPGLSKYARKQIKACDLWLTEHADVVTAVSRLLYEEKRKLNPNTYWLPNAVDTELFLRFPESFLMPLELQRASRPVLAFVGALNEWAHDWDLLDQVAALRPSWTFLLIGPLSVSLKTQQMLASHCNILCVGQKSYRELPAYLVHSNVCFQFYRLTRVNATRNSQKLFLYFAAGKPVVSTPSADVEEYRKYVALAQSAPEFISQVEESLNGWTRKDAEERMRKASENSWDQRVKTIIQILGNDYGRK